MKNFTLSCCLMLLLATAGRGQASLNGALPADTRICTGSNVPFTVSATASGTLSYQWQESTDGGISWNNLLEGTTTGANPANGIYTGTTSTVLTITRVPSTMNGNKYQALVFVNGAFAATSRAATLNVGPDVSLDNTPLMNCPGTSATLGAIPATGGNFQWQVSSNSGASWSNIVNGPDPTGVTYSGGGTGALTINPLTTAVDGYQYRPIASDGAGCTVTGGVFTQRVPTLAVFTLPAAGTVSAAVGQSASIPATITAGTGPFTYQWQVAVGAGGFANISVGNPAYTGQTAGTLNILNVTSAIYSNRYRVVVKNAGGCASSSASFAQIGVAVALPLAITTFTAGRRGPSLVKLAWTAENAAAAADFTVQRAATGNNFVDIGAVVGATGTDDYHFTDAGAGGGALQYRVKALNTDGSVVYSGVAEVAGDSGADVLELRPSVVTGGNLNLYSSLNNSESFFLTITDVTGRVLWSATVRLSKGVSSTLLDVARLGKGLYYLRAASVTGIARTMSFVRD